MKTQGRRVWYWKPGLVSLLVVGGAIISVSDGVFAQNAISDGTLGTTVQPSGSIDIITDGTQQGANLFHSFSQFNVAPDGGALFIDPGGIKNILSRVTGGSPSQIEGFLATRQFTGGLFFPSSANLFLMNPNGIIFGPNASLDVGGSFVATTADALQFGNQGFFRVSTSNVPSLLTVNPSALLFNQIAAQPINSIENKGLLSVPSGQSLLLAGSDVSIDGGALFAPGGRVELGGLAETGTVEMSVGNNLRLIFPSDVARADVSLASGASINVASGGGGNIAINAQDIDISDSFLFAGIGSGLGSVDTQAGDITLDATGVTTVTESSILNLVQSGAVGKGGDINVETGALSFSNSNIFSNVVAGAEGNAGSMSLQANDSISLENSLISSDIDGGAGQGGNIDIQAGSLSLTDGTRLSASTFGDGDAGNVSVQATGPVSLTNSSYIVSNVGAGAAGNGGAINIKAGSLALTNGARLRTAVLGAFGTLPAGRGNTGNVSIDVRDTVTIAGENNNGFPSAVFSDIEAGAVGNGGNITINTENLNVSNGGQVLASTAGEGSSGNLLVQARDSVQLTGTDVSGNNPISLGTGVFEGGRGVGGSLTIKTERLGVRDGAQVSTSTFGQGNAGDLTIQASEIALSGEGSKFPGGLFAQVDSTGTGKGGTLTIEAERLSVSDGSKVQVATFGEGDAGELLIRTTETDVFNTPTDTFFLTGIFAEVSEADTPNTPTDPITGKGNGGNLTIETERLSIRNGGQISTSTYGEGDAGNLVVRARDSIEVIGTDAIDGLSSFISADVFEGATGQGGDLIIETKKLNIKDGARVSASTSGTGRPGSIFIQNADSVLLSNNSSISTAIDTGAVVDDGQDQSSNINIQTRLLSLSNGAEVTARTSGKGDAGNILVREADSVSLDSSSISTLVGENAVGQGGSVDIQANSLTLGTRAQVSASTSGQGNAGNVFVQADGLVSLTNNSGILSTVEPGAEGNGGNIGVKAKLLSLSDGAQLQTLVRQASDILPAGRGNAGDVTIDVRDAATFSGMKNELPSGIFSSIDVGATGEGGDIEIKAGLLSLTNGAQLRSALESGATGKGGDIDIQTGSLSLTDEAQLVANTSGTGNAGNIFVQADGFVSAANRSGIFTTVDSGAVGNGGVIDIQAQSLDLSGGSELQAIVFREQNGLSGGQGEGGDIRVKATDFVSLSGVSQDGFSSGLLTSTEKGAKGPAGSITVTTDAFRIADGAVVDALTANLGRAGDIVINANTFEATGGGQVLTTTRSSGRAGDINLNVANNTTISGSDPTFDNRLDQFGEDVVNNQGSASGVFANTDVNSVGDGGNVDLKTTNFNLTDSAQVSAQSKGTGEAGNITIKADELIDANDGSITAASEQAGGSEINISAKDIRLNESSPITTSVFGGEGGGGNITINADTFIAFDDSDILANAEFGSGGNIEINSPRFLAEGFGSATAVGRNPGDFAQFRGNGRVDVSASSRFGTSGTIEAADSSFLQNSLTPLSGNFVSPEQVVAGSCLARRNVEQGSFVVTGTGGLPRSPYEAISGRYNVTGVQPIQANDSVSKETKVIESTAWKKGDPIQEAQGMVVTADGRTIVGTTPQLVALAKAQTLVCYSD